MRGSCRAATLFWSLWILSCSTVAYGKTKDARKEIKPNFDPSTCSDTTILPVRRKWNEDINSPAPYAIPAIDLPMLCEDHSPHAPFLIVVANGQNQSATEWLKQLRGMPYEIYHQDSPSDHSHNGLGLEATVYMKFIAQHYDCLPEVTLFVHSHVEQSWHRHAPLNSILRELKTSKVRGFALLHRYGKFVPVQLKHPEEMLPTHEVPMPTVEGNCGEVVNGTQYNWWWMQVYTQTRWTLVLWDLFLGKAGLGPVPEKVVMHEGAEYLINRERILARPRKFYLDALSFISKAADDQILSGFESAVAFEYIFHIIFGEGPEMDSLPTPECDLYDCETK